MYQHSLSCSINCTKVKQTATKLHKTPDEEDRARSRCLLQMRDCDSDSGLVLSACVQHFGQIFYCQPCIITIHECCYTGVTPKVKFARNRIPWKDFFPDNSLEFPGQLSNSPTFLGFQIFRKVVTPNTGFWPTIPNVHYTKDPLFGLGLGVRVRICVCSE